MYKAIQKSGKDFMGFTWFEIFKNGKTTGNSYNAFINKIKQSGIPNNRWFTTVIKTIN